MYAGLVVKEFNRRRWRPFLSVDKGTAVKKDSIVTSFTFASLSKFITRNT